MDTPDKPQSDAIATDGARSKLSALALLFALPPAVTVLAQFSLLFFLGPVGEWLNTYWFPVTRALWDKVFLDIFALELATHIKDYLTAIIFILPSYVFAQRHPPLRFLASGNPLFREGAIVLSLVLVFILAQQTFSDLWGLFDHGIDGLAWSLMVLFALCFMSVTAALILMVAITLDQFLVFGRAAVLRKNTQSPASRLRWALLTLVLFLTLGCLLAALAADIYETTRARLTYNLGLQIPMSELLFHAFPVRGPLTGLIGLLALASLLGKFRLAKGVLPFSDYFQDKPKTTGPWGAPERKKPSKLVGALFLFCAIWITFIFGVIGVGFIESMLALALLTFVVDVAQRTPQRIFNITIVVVLLLTSTYAIQAVGWAKTLVEGLV